MTKSSTDHAIPHSELVELYRQAVASGIPVEKVENKVENLMQRQHVTQEVEKTEQKKRAHTLKNNIPLVVKLGAALVPAAFLSVGLFLLGSAVLPIANYYITEVPQLQAKTLTSPIPPEQVLDVNPFVITETQSPEEELGSSVAQEPLIIDTTLDYTNLSNWFGEGTLPELAPSTAESFDSVEPGDVYTIDIPSIKIENAEVAVGGTDLNKGLIHYGGTALPGDLGSPVIFGHSVLRQFYNPSQKNPRRYMSIFSYIMTLKKGEKIYVTHNNVKYTYIVEGKTEVKPQDVYILTQQYDSRKLKLVTCTPEGTYLRRGVVTAVLVPTTD
jgi:LPXTG-site transpeptidase (sortase) family protein